MSRKLQTEAWTERRDGHIIERSHMHMHTNIKVVKGCTGCDG